MQAHTTNKNIIEAILFGFNENKWFHILKENTHKYNNEINIDIKSKSKLFL